MDIAELVFFQYEGKTPAFLKGQTTQVGYQKRVLSQLSPLWFSGDHLGKVRISSGSSYEKWGHTFPDCFFFEIIAILQREKVGVSRPCFGMFVYINIETHSFLKDWLKDGMTMDDYNIPQADQKAEPKTATQTWQQTDIRHRATGIIFGAAKSWKAWKMERFRYGEQSEICGYSLISQMDRNNILRLFCTFCSNPLWDFNIALLWDKRKTMVCEESMSFFDKFELKRLGDLTIQ